MRAVNTEVCPVIKSEEAGSAAENRMGTAGTCCPGKDSAEISTSVVKKVFVCLGKESQQKKKELGTAVCWRPFQPGGAGGERQKGHVSNAQYFPLS